MWKVLWNMMGVIGSLFTIMVLVLLFMLIAAEWGRNDGIPDPRNKSCTKSYFNRKDDQQ